MFATQGQQYARLYIDLLRKLQRADTVQAILVSINEMLVTDPSTITLYHNLATAEHPDDPYSPLINCLSVEDELAVLAALRILGLLIA